MFRKYHKPYFKQYDAVKFELTTVGTEPKRLG